MKRRCAQFATLLWLSSYLLATSLAVLFHEPHAHGDSRGCHGETACSATASHAHHGHRHACDAGHGSVAHTSGGHSAGDHDHLAARHPTAPCVSSDEQSSESPFGAPAPANSSCAVCEYLAQAIAPVTVLAAPLPAGVVQPVADLDYREPTSGSRIDCRSRAPPSLA